MFRQSTAKAGEPSDECLGPFRKIRWIEERITSQLLLESLFGAATGTQSPASVEHRDLHDRSTTYGLSASIHLGVLPWHVPCADPCEVLMPCEALLRFSNQLMI